MATKSPRVNSRQSLSTVLQEMSALKGKMDQIRVKADAKIVALETQKQADILPLWERYRDLEQAAKDYALAKEGDLLAGQTGKALTLVGGTVSFKAGRPSVQLDEAPDVIVPRLRALGLSRFVRVVEDVDRVAILKDAAAIEAVQGIRILQPMSVVTITPNAAAA